MKPDKDIIGKINTASREAKRLTKLYQEGQPRVSNAISSLYSYDIEKVRFGYEIAELNIKAQRELAEQFSRDKIKNIELLASTAIDYSSVLQTTLSIKSSLLDDLKGTLIKLPSIHIERRLGENSKLTIDVNEFYKYKDSLNDYLLVL